MGHSDAVTFWIVFVIVLFINVITPYVARGLSEQYTEYNTDNADAGTPPNLSVGAVFSISALSILSVPFWTPFMPTTMNLFLMLPLRALAWILLIRLARGV